MKLNLKQYSYLLGTGGVLVVTIIAYSLFARTEYFQSVLTWSADNLALFIFILVLIKIIGILWPPIPGIVFTVAAVPIVGWVPAFGADFVGSMIGSSIAFWLARRYGPKVILKLFGESGLKQVQRFKFKPNKELEAMAVTRVLTGAISELVSYGAGLTNIKYKNFFWGTFLSSVVVGLPLFFLLSIAFGDNGLLFGAIPLLIGLIIIYSLRNRYFSWDDAL